MNAQTNLLQLASTTLADPEPVSRAEFEESDFDWRLDHLIVARQQPETACYLNPDNQIVIRQKADWPHQEDDPYVVINPESVPALIAALKGAIS